ncbi:glycosyltransferase family 4 protein [Athalassotoga saccharophila]|uniref:glycosyltransferase family 4 protein n=1 Tax=Athalassotoga saccharophila TaxID=1441386 RepID=UPI00137B08F8|nr:glycosyltransferase family 4 protein [Athalassotoga saccharophila]BBJ27238.1 glycosyltransferase, group 1 family protein [Athalassotoga saccharophila]
MRSINIRSISDRVKGQGVDSAFKEHSKLLKKSKKFNVFVNSKDLFDILHVHTFDIGSYFLIKKYRHHHKKIVISCHVMPDSLKGSLKIPKILFPIIVKYIIHFYKQADRLVVVNPFYKDELVKDGLDPDKIVYVPNYVSDELFHLVDKTQKSELRKSLNIPQDKFVIVGAGQVQKRKGIDDFVETAKLLPDFLFVWIGGFSFGKITDGYERYKEIMKSPPSNLIFTGILDRSEVAKYFQSCDVLFLPSYQELFPMTVLEATQCGLPLVLRDIPLYKEILFDGYLSSNDANGFASLIKRLREQEAFRNEYIGRSRKIADFYSEKNVLRMWEELYDSLFLLD